MLTNRKNLAKTSGKPGKTQTINYFRINDAWHLVDLPGYGWAKVSMEKKMAWSKFVRDYLLKREPLTCLFILIDIRLEPQAIDLEFIKWSGENHIPIGLIFTKADKVSRHSGIRSVELFKKAMKQDWDKLPQIFITSAVSKEGQESLLEYIYSINGE